MATVKWINVFSSSHTLMEVNPERLMDALDVRAWKLERLPPLLEKLREGGEMDAPIVEKLSYMGFGFMNGIHRTTAAIQLGMPTIEIAVLPEEKEDLERLLNERCP